MINEFWLTDLDGDKRLLKRKSGGHYWVLFHSSGKECRTLDKFEDAFVCSAIKAGYEQGHKDAMEGK